MNLEITFRLIGGVLLLFSNAFFVATEFALTRLRQYSSDEFEEDPGLARAWKMTEQLEIYLTGCQVGITFSSVLLGIVAEPALSEILAPFLQWLGVDGGFSVAASVVLSVFLINLMHTVWAEQTPTYLGIEEAKMVAKYFAPIHYYWTKLAYPFIYMGDIITKATLRLFGVEMKRSWVESEDEVDSESAHVALRTKIVEILESGNLSEDRRQEVVNALEIDQVPVREIMVPREEIIYLSEQNSLSENLDLIQSGKSRYPLADETDSDFKGVIYTSEMLANVEELRTGEKTLRDLCRPVMTVAADMPVSELIDQFQHQHQELALITKAEKVQGLATLTDALEVIVGSAEDPMDIENSENKKWNCYKKMDSQLRDSCSLFTI